MKVLVTILVILILAAIAGYAYAKKTIDKFTFDIKFVGADLKGILSNGGFANIDLSATITNQNKFKVSVKDLYVEVYYKGQLLGKSTSIHDPFVIPANGRITISQGMTLSATSTFDIAKQFISGQKIEFEYMIKATIFNFYPLKVRGTFTY